MTLEKLFEFAIMLDKAEVYEAKFDCTGYGEITLTTDEDDEFVFTFTQDNGIGELLSAELFGEPLPNEELNYLNREADWLNILGGSLYDKLSEECEKHAGGPYWDFFFECYDEEEAA